MILTDLVRLGWLALVAALLLRLFGAGRLGLRTNAAAPVAHLARAFVVCVLLVNLLSRLHVFNAATFLAAWTAWPFARWLKRHQWSPERAMRGLLREAVLHAVAFAESPARAVAAAAFLRRARRHVRAWARWSAARLNGLSGLRMARAAAVAAIAGVAIDLRFAPVLGEPRLASPDLYVALLGTREALFNAPRAFVDGTSAAAAALSATAALNPMHTLRLIGPVVGLALTGAGALLVRLTTRSSAAALVTLAGLAVPWTGGRIETALFFLLLAALAAVRPSAASRTAIATAIVAAVVSLAPGVDAHDLVGCAAVAAALAAGPALLAAARLIRRVAAVRLDLLAAPAACALVVVLLPETPRAMYLEHRVAQQKALEIAADRPPGRWLIVAPVEQLAEAYGRGWYEEPAAFVDRYAARASDPRFRFDYAVDEMFVFVEKRPFKTFDVEPASVPFSTLVDPTYRHYRSAAGRASLEARLFVLCRDYARTHAGVSWYYDGDVLTVYRVRLGG